MIFAPIYCIVKTVLIIGIIVVVSRDNLMITGIAIFYCTYEILRRSFRFIRNIIVIYFSYTSVYIICVRRLALFNVVKNVVVVFALVNTHHYDGIIITTILSCVIRSKSTYTLVMRVTCVCEYLLMLYTYRVTTLYFEVR